MKRLPFFFLTLFFLSACNADPNTYSELVTHPKILKKAIETCQHTISESCKTVEAARETVNTLIYEHQFNPEQFGERIMTLQIQYAALPDSDVKKRAELDEQIRARLAVVGLVDP